MCVCLLLWTIHLMSKRKKINVKGTKLLMQHNKKINKKRSAAGEFIASAKSWIVYSLFIGFWRLDFNYYLHCSNIFELLIIVNFSIFRHWTDIVPKRIGRFFGIILIWFLFYLHFDKVRKKTLQLQVVVIFL